jgi:ankyrin repeat protein
MTLIKGKFKLNHLFNFLFENNFSILNYSLSDDHGFSILHWACWDGQMSIVEMLVNRGAKINSINKCEDTPLHCASQNNHIDVACYVLNSFSYSYYYYYFIFFYSIINL